MKNSFEKPYVALYLFIFLIFLTCYPPTPPLKPFQKGHVIRNFLPPPFKTLFKGIFNKEFPINPKGNPINTFECEDLKGCTGHCNCCPSGTGRIQRPARYTQWIRIGIWLRHGKGERSISLSLPVRYIAPEHWQSGCHVWSLRREARSSWDRYLKSL